MQLYVLQIAIAMNNSMNVHRSQKRSYVVLQQTVDQSSPRRNGEK